MFQTAMAGKEEKNTCYPVLCALSNKNEYIPAVKLSSSDGSFGVFPLSRVELGDVWCSEEEMCPWYMKGGKREWTKARALFARMIDYPPPFLEALMKVLAEGVYADGQQVTTKNWRIGLLAKRAKVPVDLCCDTCGKGHRGNMGWLTDHSLTSSTFLCSSVGSVCSREDKAPERRETVTETPEIEADDSDGTASWHSGKQSGDVPKAGPAEGEAWVT